MTAVDSTPVLSQSHSPYARKLAELRQTMEQDAGADIGEIEVPAALLLDDVARHLDLTEADWAHVLGEAGVEYVSSMLNQPVRLNARR
jgi:hypothetical protein